MINTSMVKSMVWREPFSGMWRP